ncbi:hypothetical protein L5515_007364 [Caenorhabditis briggsae]|uniref:BPTI/Kunitz inhibitor domain-containing protein n=1 Tax=Caenorhabditis briggsae TaxID=6238 RepID=A0AAE9F418_CAEBR|nr:hypothetical protein L5515_007364 [Caenorhabditis briggsae]
MMTYLAVTILVLIIGAESGKEHIAGACHDPLDFGKSPCDKQWSIRYHMDVSTETCLAFNFTGCGDNWNNFATSQACYEGCLPLDHHKCPAASTIYKTIKGRTACNDDCDCGKGKYCDIGHGYGQCCEQEYKDKVDSDYNPPCPPGQSIVREKLNGITVQLIDLPPQCTAPLVMKSNSSDDRIKPKLKFHFDRTTGFCMSFLEFRKQDNSFDNIAACTSTCLRNNYKGCPFQRNPIIPIHCHSNKDCNQQKTRKSSKTLYCTREGTCCDTKDLKELRTEFNVTCPWGGQKIQYAYKSSTRLLIGKTCDSKMCPTNSTCHQSKYFAYCCQNHNL